MSATLLPYRNAIKLEVDHYKCGGEEHIKQLPFVLEFICEAFAAEFGDLTTNVQRQLSK